VVNTAQMELYACGGEEKSGSLASLDCLRTIILTSLWSGKNSYFVKAAARPPHSKSELGAEGVFVEADGGGAAGVVVDGEDVETAGAIRNVAFV
jgi:hypothetical protein